jgi:hypothetical protein
MKKSIYLYWFDIDDSGNKAIFSDSIERCLILYALFFERVVLQSSSALKLPELARFFCAHTDFFIKQNYADPLISFSLENPRLGFRGYLDNRMRTIGKLYNYRYNEEYARYVNFHAANVAKQLDDYIKETNIYKTQLSVDDEFRKLLSSSPIATLDATGESAELLSLVNNCALNEEVFQTFDMLRRAEKLLHQPSNSTLINRIGKEFRKRYYAANAISNQCLLPAKNTYTDYIFIEKFCRFIGLDILFRGATKLHLSAELVNNIKNNSSFCFLVNAYFSYFNATQNVNFKQELDGFKVKLREFTHFLRHLLS